MSASASHIPVAAEKTPNNQASSLYRPELDGVRFFAFLFVYLHHALPRVKYAPDGVTILPETRVWHFYAPLVDSFGFGLCLFFMLSAYLITSLLLEERKRQGVVSIRNFYIRRILRIWPLYIFGLLIAVVWGMYFHESSDLMRLLAYIFFVGNIFTGYVGWTDNPMSPLWSISIEEQFYLIWPWAMRSLSRRGLAICAGIFILAANAALLFLYCAHANLDYAVWTNTLVQFEMFAAGILLALLPKQLPKRSLLGWCSVAVTIPLWYIATFCFHIKDLTGPVYATSAPALIIAYALAALGCITFLIGFCSFNTTMVPKWMTELGKISYGLYVYHMLVFTLLFNMFHLFSSHAIRYTIPLAFIITVVLAKLSYRYFEKPFLLLKRRFESVHSRAV